MIEKMEWISVKDRLPSKEGHYLVYEDVSSFETNDVSSFLVDYFNIYRTEKGTVEKWFSSYEDATHWMPLPEPPKE